MTVTIRPDDEQVIADAIRTGAYQNADEVIARALEVLRADEEWLDESRLAIGEKIDRAFAQFEQGEFVSAEESKADMAARKKTRRLGFLEGQGSVPDDFDRMNEDEIRRLFERMD